MSNHTLVMVYRAETKDKLVELLIEQARQLDDWVAGPVMRTAMRGERFGSTLYMDTSKLDTQSRTAALCASKLKINEIGRKS